MLGQSPASGSTVRKGATVTIEATPGNPPPTAPLTDLVGQPSSVASQLQSRGYIVTQSVEAPPLGFLLPTGLPPAPGQVWQTDPPAGTVAPDGKVTLRVQP